MTTPEVAGLRELTEADLPTLFLQQLDVEAANMAVFVPRDRDAFFPHWRKILANASALTRGVVTKGELAGYVASYDADSMRVIAYWIGREYWGRGIASSALGLFLRLENRRPLHAFVATSNTRSARVLEKNGFRMVRHQAEEAVYVLD